jgi:uncharacterized protein YukE
VNMLGMDVGEVRSFANQLDSRADEIEQIVNTLSNALHQVQWQGNDANGFRHDWESTHRSQLNTVANALRDAARVANNNANQQEQTSAS